MRGLRTKENNAFKRFIEEVQKQASLEEKVFFLDFGECKDIVFKDMIIDELFGWLVPFNIATEFEKNFLAQDNLEAFSEFCVWCIPRTINNELTITFEI